MSEVKYIKCDGVDCGRVTPYDYSESPNEGWARITVFVGNWYGYDLCPDCAKKALEAVGLE